MNKNSLIVAFLLFLIMGCSGSVNPGNSSNDEFRHPFSPSSIWNRRIPTNAEYIDVSDAIWGDSLLAPKVVYPDIITVAYVDGSQPLVDFRLNRDWNYPQRSIPRGDVLFQRRLSFSAGTEIRYPSNGNGIYAIIDPATGLADEGGAGWREPGSDFLTFYDDPALHGIDVVNGDGLSGPRGSGLSGLGGALRLGEIDTSIDHALSVMMAGKRYSRDIHYIWPASTCDSYADDPVYGYLGPNPNYTMGTLLAIPYSIDLDSLTWITNQGRNIAQATQTYGMYISDSDVGTAGDSGGTVFLMAIERQAAYVDLGLMIDHETNDETVDPAKIDMDGFTIDIMNILHLVKAVNNTP